MFNLKGLFKKKPSVFYQYFLTIAKNIVQASNAFIDQMKHLDDPAITEEYFLEIKKLEHLGDKYTNEVVLELNKSFITPLEREDIMELTFELDDVLNRLMVLASQMAIYGINECDEFMLLFTKNIQVCVNELYSAINLLSQNKLQEMAQHTLRLNNLEDEANELLRNGLRQLFNSCTDPIDLIKKKEIYTMMESFSDLCEDVADILEGIILRNS